MNLERTVQFTTECKNCVFAYPLYNKVDKRIGMLCHFDRIPRFEEQKLIIYEDNYPIIQTVCNAKRDSEWTSYYEDPITEVLKQVQVQCDFIILSYQDKNPDAKLVQSAKQCMKSIIKPRRIIFVVKNETISNLTELLATLHDVIDNIEFFFVKIIDNNKLESECIEEGFSKVISTYYTVFQTNNEIPLDFIQKLNDFINVKCRKVSLIKPIFGLFHGLTIQSALHKLCGGYKHYFSFEKFIIELAKQQNLQSLIINYEEL